MLGSNLSIVIINFLFLILFCFLIFNVGNNITGQKGDFTAIIIIAVLSALTYLPYNIGILIDLLFAVFCILYIKQKNYLIGVYSFVFALIFTAFISFIARHLIIGVFFHPFSG